VLGEVTVGETVAEGVVVGVLGTVGVADVGETVGVIVAVGVTDGVGVALGVVVGVDVGVVEGAGVDVVVAGGDWIGRTRLGPVLRRPVSISAIASAATAPTAIAPPVAMPVLRRLHEPDPRVGEERHAVAQPFRLDLVVGVDDADDLGVRVGEML
jgi:hypothetical protein